MSTSVAYCPSRFIANYKTQRKGESIHSPETCLPGGGWEFRKAGTFAIPLGAGSGVQGSEPAPEGFNPVVQLPQQVPVQRINESPPTITVNRTVIEKGDYKGSEEGQALKASGMQR